MKKSTLAMLAAPSSNISEGGLRVATVAFLVHNPDPQLLTFCTSDKLPGGTWNFVTCLKVVGPHHDGNMFYFRYTNTSTYTFSRVRNGLKMMVSGLKSSSRKISDVRLRPEWAGHLPRCCGMADMGPGVIDHDRITLGTF